MKFFSAPKIACLLVLTSQMIFAGNSDSNTHLLKSSLHNDIVAGLIAKGNDSDRYATSGFAGSPYPLNGVDGSGVILSQNRNFGKKSGAISLTSEGVEVDKRGDYLVNFSVLINNLDGGEDSFVPYQVLVQRSDNFDINDPLNVSGISVFDVQSEGSIGEGNFIVLGDGILKNVAPGTRISLIIRSFFGPTRDITVSNWKISISEIET